MDLEVTEMRMLRWSLGWTRQDRIRNERIRNMTRVGQFSVKIRQSRLSWFGHVMRRDDQYVGKRVLNMELDGRRRRGRPKRRWMDVVKSDMKLAELDEEDALDREIWKNGICYNECHSCLLYTSPSPRDATLSRMPSSA